MGRSVVSALALLGALGIALPVQAQGFDLGEIVFSAFRAETEGDRTGAAVTVIDAEELEAAGDVPVAQVLARVPGVSIAATGPLGAQTSLRVRGTHPRYLRVYVDGILINDPSAPAGDVDFGGLTTAGIARIEVLRGTQSAVHGGGAVGGVIAITSRRPEVDGTEQSAAVEGGSFGTRGLRYGLSHRTGPWEARLDASIIEAEGYSAVPGPGADDDGFAARRLSLGLRYQASDALALGLTVFGQVDENDYDNWPSGPGAANTTDRRQVGARIFGEYEAGGTRHVVDVTAYRIERENRAAGIDRFDGRRLAASWVGTTDIAQGFTLIYGADWMRETGRNPSFAGELSESVAGVFVTGQWAPSDRLDIALTGRFDDHSGFGRFASGRASFAWRPVEGLTLRGAVANGFRTPTLSERFGAFGNPDLAAETSRSAELGADYALPGGAAFGLTAFWLSTEDEIAFNPANFFIPENIEAARRRGVELSGSLPLGRFTLEGAYTYTEAEITAGPSAGRRLLRVPRHDAALSLAGEIAPRLTGTLTLQHVGGAHDVRTDFSRGPVPDWTVAHVALRYALTDAADLTLRVENLFDRDYQSVSGYDAPGRGVYLGLAARF